MSLVVGLLLWPRGAVAGPRARRSPRRTWMRRRTSPMRSTELDASTAEALRAAGASRRLDDTFRGYLAERGSKPVPLEDVTRLVNGVAGIRLHADAVADLSRRRRRARPAGAGPQRGGHDGVVLGARREPHRQGRGAGSACGGRPGTGRGRLRGDRVDGGSPRGRPPDSRWRSSSRPARWPAASLLRAVQADAVIFDLDGVLADSRIAFARCVNAALVAAGVPERPAADLHRYLGPPLHATFVELTGDASLAQGCLDAYRARYREHAATETDGPGRDGRRHRDARRAHAARRRDVQAARAERAAPGRAGAARALRRRRGPVARGPRGAEGRDDPARAGRPAHRGSGR